MDSIEEKRVFDGRAGATDAYVASAEGVLRVALAGDRVGDRDLRVRCAARDVAATGEAVAVATDEDVRVLDRVGGTEGGRDGGTAVDRDDGSAVAETGFGPAVAVGFHEGALVAADDEGRVARYRDETGWEALGDRGVSTVRALDGGLVGTADGVYRVHDGDLDHAGLTDVRDVSAVGVPLAATATGLYELGNGWLTIREGACEVVAAAPPGEGARLGRAHAVADGARLEHDPADGEWREREPWATPDGDERVVGIAYGERAAAVTADGTLFVETDAEDGQWRSWPLGVTGVTGIAVPG